MADHTYAEFKYGTELDLQFFRVRAPSPQSPRIPHTMARTMAPVIAPEIPGPHGPPPPPPPTPLQPQPQPPPPPEGNRRRGWGGEGCRPERRYPPARAKRWVGLGVECVSMCQNCVRTSLHHSYTPPPDSISLTWSEGWPLKALSLLRKQCFECSLSASGERRNG